MSHHLPLSGVRVVDFSRVLAGPFCTMMLADLGAEVIKIEHITRGDDTRSWGPPYIHMKTKTIPMPDENDERHDDKMSAYFASINRNKKSLALNLKEPRGVALARQLMVDPNTDIVVENFKVGGMASYNGDNPHGRGLDFASIQPLHPRLVYCSITGFGQTGPLRYRPGYDFAIQAVSGLMSITGDPASAPQKVGVAISDVIAGLFAANGIQAALRQAQQTGNGQHVDISLLDTQLASLVNVAANFLVTLQTPPRLGNAHPNIVPYQTFAASGGQHFVLAVGNDGQFQKLCDLIRQPAWKTDARFATNPARVAHREVLEAELQSVFATKPASYWLGNLLDLGVPAAPIHNVGDALTDEQVLARGLVQTVKFWDPNDDTVIRATADIVGSPLKFSNTTIEEPSAPPGLGEHTDDVLTQVLGLSSHVISELKTQGVVR